MAITKQYWSAALILERVKDELDMNEEAFVDDVEMLGYCNAAIDRAEQQVIGIYQDYFLTSEQLSLVSGTREYALPANIYAHKIRRMIYENGSQVYKVTRIGDWKKFERMAIEDVNNSATLYEYFLINDLPGEPRINFVPIPNETGAFIKIWYLRQANRFDREWTAVGDDRVLDTPLQRDGSDGRILDVPEAFNYIVEFVKMKCDIKEKRLHGQVQSGDYPEVLMEFENFIGVISEMVPDAENLIEADYSTYEEHS